MNEQDIFVQSLRQADEDQRLAYLAQACAGQPALRQRVEVLLNAHERVGHFLESPAAGCVATLDQAPAELPGTVIGPYKLLQEIGEGGMGVVYMAEQERPVRRRVALKIIKPGMDSRQVIARFEAERQALAMMDHQNIAKVLDAGTVGEGASASGWWLEGEQSRIEPTASALATSTSHSAARPYFVMELVHGVPLTQFCDDKRLSVRQRLELFIPVCHAIQHAHQKGIIHRDIKPSNVLVTMYDDKPVPKVIDFGVAKAVEQRLTDKTLFTHYGTLVGTFEYMSPEQAEMNALGVDTRSDIYSLGVLLYELLTGQTPFDRERLAKSGIDEIRRIIREEEPETVSQRLARTKSSRHTPCAVDLNGTRSVPTTYELDWIVMKSLEKDRTRRYESASSLAADIERYLNDEPVQACPPSTLYRIQKFARKHKPALATAAAIALCLLLGTTVSAWQAVRATTAEAQANANEAQAQASAEEARQKAQEATTQRDEAQKQRDEVKALNDKLAAKEQQLLRTLYAANMKLAKNAWEESAVHQARELLEQHRPKPGETDLRGFEWYYLDRLCHSELLTLKGHTGPVWSVAYSSDGNRLATASWDGTVKVWDAQAGQALLTVKSGGESVAFSLDGKRLAGPSRDNTVTIWDAQTGQELQSIKGHTDSLRSLAFSPDGNRLASSSNDKTVKVWDALTGEELLSLKSDAGRLAFSPDGKRLAIAANEEMVRVWDAQTGRELLSIKFDGRNVAFSPDGNRLASGSKVFDSQTGQQLFEFKGPTGHGVNSVAFSPDGKRLATAGADRMVKVWNSETGEELFTFKGHANMAWSVAFSPDGTRLASTSLDGTVNVWNANTGPEARIFSRTRGWVDSIAFSPDGDRLASCGGFYDDTKYSGVLEVLNARTGQEILNIKGRTYAPYTADFSTDGKRLAGAAWDPTTKEEAAKVWDAQTGQELLALKVAGRRPVFSPDGKRLASALDDNTVKVWDAQTGQELLTCKGHTNAVSALAFSRDGIRLASASGSTLRRAGEVKVWDAQTGQELLSIKAHTDVLRGLAFSPDGTRLASGCSANSSGLGPGGIGEVKVWDTQTGNELLNLKGHTAEVSGVVFSPDGKRLASASGSTVRRAGEVKVWDAQTGHDLLTLKGGTYSHHVAFSPNGQWLVSNAGGKVRIYDATPLPNP